MPRGEQRPVLTDLGAPARRSVASVPLPELRDRLMRARAALAAVRRAPDSKAARTLETDLARQIRTLERDLAKA